MTESKKPQQVTASKSPPAANAPANKSTAVNGKAPNVNASKAPAANKPPVAGAASKESKVIKNEVKNDAKK